MLGITKTNFKNFVTYNNNNLTYQKQPLMQRNCWFDLILKYKQ